MKVKNIALISFLFLGSIFYAQEIQSTVTVDYSQVQSSNNQVFKSLEKSLTDFVNKTRWTTKTFKTEEKIECAFFISIQEKVNSNQYKASITVQSRRPVFNSNYYTPVLNMQDSDFTFNYVEFQSLIFNERKFSGDNLTDVIGFYVYLILGYDADTFEKNGGTEYFNTAKKISQIAENNGFTGWSTFDGIKSRASIISEILKPINNNLRNLIYNYHLNGLDKFSNQELYAKNNMINNLSKLKSYENNALFYPLEMFISAKKEEIVGMLSGGQSSTANISELKQTLETIAPKYSSDWSKIKN